MSKLQSDYKIKSIDELSKYDHNSRVHSKSQIEQIANSIKEFGFTNPILIDDKNIIIAGHARFDAAKKLALKEVPCIVINNLTEPQKRAYVIADNKLALNSDWDLDLLRHEINALNVDDFDLSLTGFDEKEINMMINDDILKNYQDLSADDAVDTEGVVSRAKRGDVFLLGEHRLMCGDSTSDDDVTRLMDGCVADMVFSDPPYGMQYKSHDKKFDMLLNDDTILDIYPIIDKFSNGFVFIWTSWRLLLTWMDNLKGLGYPSNCIIWHKACGGMGDTKSTFSQDYEMCMVWHRGGRLVDKRIGSVWQIDKDSNGDYIHPTQKPVALAETAIKSTTKTKDIVLDLFGGSGSTLIACQKLKRKSYTMELDTKYCDVIIKRWEDYTGDKATLAT